ncbi:hypothetical protein ACDQ55_11265 [Chitinophaga sp. 30R24]|uniref:anti-sigma factor family protein n=1 Tax=Chitinophaga sp. 30R24 TaxID=3248838 RepID=UPI003B90A006
MTEKHLHTLLPCCKEATMLAEKQLQQPLSGLQRIGLRLHLMYCTFCRRYVKQSGAIDRYLHDYMQQPEKVTLEETIKLQWKALIAEKLKP